MVKQGNKGVVVGEISSSLSARSHLSRKEVPYMEKRSCT